MRHSWFALLTLASACRSAPSAEPRPSPVGASASGPGAAPALPLAASKDSVTLERERYVADVRRQIAGKEALPASQVFRNIKMLTDLPAGRLLAVMNIGYGKSLGVSCTHCHVPDAWDREDKTQKQTARDMSRMVATINNELLANIPNLKGPGPVVNCTTCHRGHIMPALDLP